MSDLISRSALLQMLKYNKAIHEDENGETRQLVAVDINKVIEYVEKMPTAYDVEAVVEKMEEIADKAVGGCHTLEPCSHMADDTKCMDCITERFTEVVRSGGKE